MAGENLTINNNINLANNGFSSKNIYRKELKHYFLGKKEDILIQEVSTNLFSKNMFCSFLEEFKL